MNREKSSVGEILFWACMVVGVAVGAGLVFFSSTASYDMAQEARMAIWGCQRTLPRDTNCVLTAVVEVE